MTGSKYLAIIAIILMAVINIISTVSCDNIATVITTAKEQITSSVTIAKENIGSFTKTQISLPNIGIIKGIYVGPQTPYNPFSYFGPEKHYFFVLVEPTNAEPNKNYRVSLYEKGQLRQNEYISWNQPELNVKTAKYVLFDLITEDEWKAYSPNYFLPPSPDTPQNMLNEINSNYPTESLSPSIFEATITLEESYLPNNNKLQPDLKLERLSIIPQQAHINETVIITIWVVNETGDNIDATTNLEINGQLEETKTISNCPQRYNPQCTVKIGCPITFFTKKTQPGTYNVDIGGQKGTFTIK
jgi:hypothetical protein